MSFFKFVVDNLEIGTSHDIAENQSEAPVNVSEVADGF